MSTLWGGRFREKADEALWTFTVSREDRRLLIPDIRGSFAHVRMLAKAKLISEAEEQALLGGLEKILSEGRNQTFTFLETDEDVHSAVERRLGELVGEVAGKLHTGRSRNDQVALDLRLYLLEASQKRSAQLQQLVRALVERAKNVGETIIPAYTHLQPAQAIPLAHHLLAYTWMFRRDVERFQDGEKRISISPLGAGAVGGSSLPLQPSYVAKELHMSGSFDNSIDAVSSRDFVSEYAFCVAQTMIHLSRLSEELILWNTREFSWITIPDGLATGSSMLPQKKNPDMAELTRGKTAVAVGDLMALLALQKGLPLAYNRDLQEDKTALFRADDILEATLHAMGTLLQAVEFHPPEPDDSVCAIDLAERLVEKNVPFREAHQVIGKLILELAKRKKTLRDATLKELQTLHPKFDASDLGVLSPRASVEMRRSPGGGSFASVQEQIKKLETWLTEESHATR